MIVELTLRSREQLDMSPNGIVKSLEHFGDHEAYIVDAKPNIIYVNYYGNVDPQRVYSGLTSQGLSIIKSKITQN